MSYVTELFRQVFASLMRNKLRSFLTMAGIAWGVASIVLIVAMGEGFKQGQRKRMKALGENIVIVFGGRTERQAGGQRAGRRIRLTYDDVRDIRTEAYLVRFCVGELRNRTRAPESVQQRHVLGGRSRAVVLQDPHYRGRPGAFPQRRRRP